MYIHFYIANKYSLEDFYSIAVIGYLKAVQIYIRDSDIKEKYSFSCLAWLYMKSEIKDHFKAENRYKRTAENIISLDSLVNDDGSTYEIVGNGTIEQDQVNDELIREIVSKLSDLQKSILSMKIQGYSNVDICRVNNIPSSSFYAEMKKIKAITRIILA